MTKALLKDTLREIRHSFGRFMSILIIVMLGVSFFAGLRAAGPDMEDTADAYFDEQNLMDIRLVSTLGFTEEDVADIQATQGVKEAEPSYSMDVMANSGDTAVVAKLYSLSDTMNVPVLLEGRMPEKSGECLAEEGKLFNTVFGLGSTITLSSGVEGEDLADSLATTEYTVVGIVRSPYYISFERGTTTLGSGEIDTFLMLPEEDFTLDVYTDVFLTVDGADQYNTFSEEYKQTVGAVADTLEENSEAWAQRRYDEIYDEAAQELADAEQELADGREEMDRELADAEAELADAEQKLADGRADFEEGQREFDEQIAAAEKELRQGEQEIEAGEAEYQKNKDAFDEAEPAALQAIEEGEAELAAAKETLDASKAELDALAQVLETGLLNDEMRAQLQGKYDQGLEAYTAGLGQYEQGMADLAAGQERLEQGRQSVQQAEQALEQSRQELETKRQELDALKALIDSGTLTEQGKERYEAILEEGERDYAAAEDRLQTEDNTLEGQKQALESLEEQLQQAEGELATTKTQLDQAKIQLDGLKAQLDSGRLDDATRAVLQQTYDTGKAQYDQGYAEYEQGVAKLEASRQQLEAGRTQLEEAKAQLDSGRAEIEAGWATLEEQRQAGQQELDDAWQEIEDGEAELAQGRLDYEEAKKEAEEELADAEQQIADGRKELEELADCTWYVFDREDNTGVSEYEHAAERMDAMAQIFPMIFLVVAALVCLNTMTRMVDEQRTYIGTLKGLGYSNGAIAAKYILYAAIASVVGSVIGVIGGIQIFPQVIFGAYSIMFTMPSIQLNFYPETALTGAIAAVAVTTLAAFIGCRNSLRASPAKLMRPKAPKAGKRVLIERIGFIWKRMSFTGKVTMRNLFRYKKRFIMTVCGITGSMALLLAGFGIKDSVGNILVYQFEDINQYQLIVGVDGDATAVEDEVRETCGTEQTIAVMSKTVDVEAGGEEMSVTLTVPEDAERFAQFIRMRGRLDHKEVAFNSTVLTEKAAYKTGAEVGQEFTVHEGDSEQYTLTLGAETENYAGHYLYMTEELYRQVWGEEPEYNSIYVQLPEGTDRDALGEALLQIDDVVMLSFMDDVADDFTDMIETLDYVVMVLIISAAALAFLILYNLTNLNISERYREISTLKVLGFYDKEVLSYVYRENFILTFIGIILGCFLGTALHYYIITTVEVDAVMFGRTINFISYVWSVILVTLFALSVNFVMYFKLRKINMVEALKSVE